MKNILKTLKGYWIKFLVFLVSHLYRHTVVPIGKSGGQIIILDTRTRIGAEEMAMLQALHSRSPNGILDHFRILLERGAQKFMQSFYVGYGHKSIGDCGTVTIFIEGVSMLTAKAVQDNMLYSGQECSTRYIDFSTQSFIDPFGSSLSKKIMDRWREFYVKNLDPLKSFLREKFPKNEGEKEAEYQKAINARAFDILRGFLPAGASTNLAWTTNLRQAADKLMLLRHHPLAEVRVVAKAIETALLQAYPSSFGHKLYETTESYNGEWMRDAYLHHDSRCKDFSLVHNGVSKELLQKHRAILGQKRPPKTEVPKIVGEAGTLTFEYLLDFGSFRDIQRHRACVQRMPLLTTRIGFEEWYLAELPEEMREMARKFLDEQESKIDSLSCSSEDKQYFVAMGYLCSCRITGDIPALVYLVELRATRFVHPTLRRKARMMAETLEALFFEGMITIHLDQDPDRFDIKRGAQDIVLKEDT